MGLKQLSFLTIGNCRNEIILQEDAKRKYGSILLAL